MQDPKPGRVYLPRAQQQHPICTQLTQNVSFSPFSVCQRDLYCKSLHCLNHTARSEGTGTCLPFQTPPVISLTSAVMTRVVLPLLGSQGSGSAPREPFSTLCQSRWSGMRKMEFAESDSPHDSVYTAVSNSSLVGGDVTGIKSC